MHLVLNTLGTLLTLIGIVWMLQGVNILPGSFMTGQMEWAMYGAIAAAIGVALLVVAWRRG